MGYCSNCKYCYELFENHYRCMLNRRHMIKDLFVLCRIGCNEHKPVELNLDAK